MGISPYLYYYVVIVLFEMLRSALKLTRTKIKPLSVSEDCTICFSAFCPVLSLTCDMYVLLKLISVIRFWSI